jgi:tetratricopeptide (TPR) repeat protein
MNLFTSDKSKTYSLLSVGERGVGKTVFLAGSYFELNKKGEKIWLESQDSQAQTNLKGVFDYIQKNRQYPPATMKITTFNFTLKQRSLIGKKTLCHFRWWDIPGESCNIDNADFQKIVLGSHSCCLFINTYELVTKPNYLASIEPIIKQVVAIASLVNQHQMSYAFAVILTQCDRLDTTTIGKIKIEEKLQPLIARLRLVKAKCQQFYSAITLENEGDSAQLNPKGAAEPLLWLASELNRADDLQLYQSLDTGVSQKFPLSSWRSASSKSRFILPLFGLGILSAIGYGLFSLGLLPFKPTDNLVSLVEKTNIYLEREQIDEALPLMEKIVAKDPNNVDWQLNLINVYELKGQLDKALPLMTKIASANPSNVEWQIKLANLYEAKSQYSQAEQIYDRILTERGNDLNALLRKALLRIKQKDVQTAKTLFQQAEQAAPTNEMKTRVRSIANNSL